MGYLAFYSLLITITSSVLLQRPIRVWRNQHWWKLVPVTPEVDSRAAMLALAGIRRRGRRSAITIVRLGSSSVVSNIWLGIAGHNNPKSAAEAIAHASGCSLGATEKPPALDRSGRWWKSVPVAPPPLPVEPRENRRLFGKKDPELSQILPGAYDETVIGFFAEHADTMLSDGDAFAITAAPHADGRHTRAMALTTSRSLGTSWTDSCPLKVSFPTLSPFFFGICIPTFLALFALLAESGVLGSFLDQQVHLATTVTIIYSLVLIIGLPMTSWEIMYPRMVRGVMSKWHLPMTYTARRRSGLIPSGQLAGWANGGGRTAVSAPSKLAPELVTVSEGVMLGHDAQGRECYISDTDRQWGMMTLGDPGTGKTTLNLNVLYGDVLARARGVPRSIIYIETKGEGASRAEQVIAAAGWQPAVVKASTEIGPRLEIIDWDDPRRSARLLTEAIRYAYEHDDIRERSAEILNAVLYAVIGASKDAGRHWGYTNGRANVLRVAYRLLGGEAATKADQHALQVLKDYSNETSEEFLSYLADHSFRSKRDVGNIFEAPYSKIQGLLPVEPLFEVGSREWVDLRSLVTDHHVTVLDLSPKSGEAASNYTDITARRTAAIMCYLIWDTVKLQCDSWQAQGKSIAIYSDELCDIAGYGDAHLEIIRAMADQGRSRGLLPVFATQRPTQIPERTRESVMSFSTKAYFKLQNWETAERAVLDLDEVYGTKEIRNFPKYSCAARISCQGISQPAFTLYPQNL